MIIFSRTGIHATFLWAEAATMKLSRFHAKNKSRLMGISLVLAFLPHKKRREVECPYDMRLSTAQTGKDKQPTPHKGRYAQTDRTRAACIANRCRHLHADRRERPSYSPVLKLSRFHVENKRNSLFFKLNIDYFAKKVTPE